MTTTAPGPQTVKVRLGGPLMSAGGGRTEFEVEASTISQLLARLAAEHPQLKPMLEKGVSVAVDGHIYRGAFQQPVKPGSEIFLLPPLAGG